MFRCPSKVGRGSPEFQLQSTCRHAIMLRLMFAKNIIIEAPLLIRCLQEPSNLVVWHDGCYEVLDPSLATNDGCFETWVCAMLPGNASNALASARSLARSSLAARHLPLTPLRATDSSMINIIHIAAASACTPVWRVIIFECRRCTVYILACCMCV